MKTINTTTTILIAVLAAATLAHADAIPPGWYADYASGTYVIPEGNGQELGVSIGFDFSFYGAGNFVTSDASIRYSGHVGLGSDVVGSADLSVPGNWPVYRWDQAGARILAPLSYPYNFNWPRDKGKIYYQTIGEEGRRRFVVTFDVYLDAPETQNALFQLQLHEDTGRIQFSYCSVHENLSDARIGINYGDGVTHTSFWYDRDARTNGDGVCEDSMDELFGSLEGVTLYFDYDADSGSYVMTPEPTTLGMLTLAGLGLLLRRRRRRFQNSARR